MRKSISAQSWESVPPAPALMETSASFVSSSSSRVICIENFFIFFSSPDKRAATSFSLSLSDSSRARSRSMSASSISL